jgi:sugar O-acyltransferase (sialic acid O-acetyltransferase NeuD family)
MSEVVIFGLSEFAEVAQVYLREDSPHDVVGYTVDEQFIEDDTFSGLPVTAFERLAEKHPPERTKLFVATGYGGVNQRRRDIVDRCKEAGYELIGFVHPRARVPADFVPGENTFIFEDNVIQPFVRIGDNVILWSGNHIGHHSVIEDNCFIASHVVISGGVTIGEFTFIGVNATFRDHIKVGARNVIGAGALIMKDTEEGSVYSIRATKPLEMKSWELENF